MYSSVVAPFLRFEAPLPNQLYVLGGRNREQGPLDLVEMFDTWHGHWVKCPNMSAKRAGCTAADLPDGRVLVVGGYDERGIVEGTLATCEVFDPHTQSWDSAVAPLSRPRWGHGSATVGGQVYAVGGCSLRTGAPAQDAFMETLTSCEVYDVAANQWSPCPSLCVARAGCRLVSLGERYLAAVGGCDDVFGRAETLQSVELFDIDAGRWSLLNLKLDTPRTCAAVAALDHESLLVVGGAPALPSAEVYKVTEPSAAASHEEGRPSVPAVSDIMEGRMGCQAVVLNLPSVAGTFPLCTRRCVVVVGGESDEDWDYDQALPVGGSQQFSSALVYDVGEGEWRWQVPLPPMETPRTAMALCVSFGRIRGYPC